jgi:hypothetical protein
VPPPADTTRASAYAVGDRGRIMFDEIVVSLPLRGANAPYQNLHIAPAALVNPRKTTPASPSEAEGILRRLETRVAARLTEMLTSLKEQSLEENKELRRRILAEAQAAVDDVLRQWEHASDYRVEIVIANLYWTDSSVGRLQPLRRGWWD